MMLEIYRDFKKSIIWNAFESISYQLLLLGHQLLLFGVTHKSTYGLIGTLFSITYLIVMISNFGLDITLTPFFTYISRDKETFRKFFIIQLLPEYFLLGTLFLSCLFLRYYTGIFGNAIDNSLIITIGLLIFFEGLKKTLRMILQLANHNHKTAPVEIATILFYIAVVWACYAWSYKITPHLVFMPLLFVSGVSCAILGLFVFSYYQSLSGKKSNHLDIAFHLRILKNRLFNFLNQASHIAFSSNFLVPCFAFLISLDQAGILKLISSIAHCITSIIQRIFGTSSNMVLSKIKDKDEQTQQQAFLLISNSLHQALLGLTIFFTLNYNKITQLNLGTSPSANSTLMIAYLFLFIICSENLFLAHERFYIAQEKSQHLFVFNIFMMILIALVISQATHILPTTLLALLFAIRICAYCLLSLMAFSHWKIKPSFQIQPISLAISICISLLFYVAA